MIESKEDIISGLKTSFKEVAEWLSQQADDRFEKGPEGKWDTSQHLDHLWQIAKMIRQALSLPRFVLRWRFGKPNRVGRNYDGLVKRYQEKLAGLQGQAPGMTMKRHPKAQKEALIQDFLKRGDRLVNVIKRWPDSKLDQYLVPHPLLGKLTIRELLFWTIYHNYHHLKNLKENY